MLPPRNDQISILTGRIMRALQKAHVLLPDAADNPLHYNTAYMAVTNALDAGVRVNSAATKAIDTALNQAKLACAKCGPREEKKINS